MDKRPLLYINVPWMKRYEGASDQDKPIGKFGFTLAHQMDDHCQFNFARFQNNVYGHVPGSTNPNLTKLGGARSATFVRGITVVWIATDPDSGGRVVVGWYQNATVWKTRQTPTDELARQRTTKESDDISQFTVEARAKFSKCLPPGQRPRLKIAGSGPGQSPFWYGDKSADEQIRQLVAGKKFNVRSSQKPPSKQSRGGWIQDPAERMQIENIAMETVRRHYSENGYQVEDISGENRGYDFLAQSQTAELHVEVKGCKGNFVCVELTPNEFSYAKKNHKMFRLCVVLDALKKQNLKVFRPNAKVDQWYDESGNKLSTIEKVGATIRE